MHGSRAMGRVLQSLNRSSRSIHMHGSRAMGCVLQSLNPATRIIDCVLDGRSATGCSTWPTSTRCVLPWMPRGRPKPFRVAIRSDLPARPRRAQAPKARACTRARRGGQGRLRAPGPDIRERKGGRRVLAARPWPPPYGTRRRRHRPGGRAGQRRRRGAGAPARPPRRPRYPPPLPTLPCAQSSLSAFLHSPPRWYCLALCACIAPTPHRTTNPLPAPRPSPPSERQTPKRGGAGA